jgi:hypothetical protein
MVQDDDRTKGFPTNWKTIVPLILSDDYKERFKGEVYEVNRRILALEKVLEDNARGKLGFKLDSGEPVLTKQLSAMVEYRNYLLLRAQLENIKL